MIDAVVIGAGQYGLAASWHLSRRGIEHVVIERGQIAETWRSQRWDAFALNTPNWMNRLAGETEAVEPRDAFLTRDGWIARLEDHARRTQVPVRTATTVTGVDAGPGPGTYLVAVDGPDGRDTIETRHVVVASGGQSAPRRPALSGSLPSDVLQLHTSEYRSPSALPEGAVLVVGSAQSGVQVAEDLVGAGRTTHLATSPVARLRRRYRGRDTLEWLVECGFYDATLEQLPDPRMAKAPIPQISGVGRYGHTVSLQSLADLGVRLLGRPVGVDGGRIEFDDSLGANIAAGDQGSAILNGIMDAWIERTAGILLPVEPDPADTPHPDPMSVRSPAVLDLERDRIGTVIWATGYEVDFGYLHLPVLDAAGLPVHDHGAARTPGIHFLGLRWLNDRKSALITAADAEAAAMADRLAASPA